MRTCEVTCLISEKAGVFYEKTLSLSCVGFTVDEVMSHEYFNKKLKQEFLGSFAKAKADKISDAGFVIKKIKLNEIKSFTNDNAWPELDKHGIRNYSKFFEVGISFLFTGECAIMEANCGVEKDCKIDRSFGRKGNKR